MITGNGTAESHYIISGDDITTVWNELLEVIKKDGVYVDLEKAYIFDLDKIYKDSDMPKGIDIGYDTVLDGNNSELKSLALKAEAFDFEGQSAIVKEFLTLPYKDSYADNYLEIVDTGAKWLNAVSSSHNIKNTDKLAYYSRNFASGRLKCVKNIVIDFDNESTRKIITSFLGDTYRNGFRIFQCENLTIKNHRNLTIDITSCYGNGNEGDNSYRNFKIHTAVYNLNVIDCYSEDSYNIYIGYNSADYIECYFKVYNFSMNTFFNVTKGSNIDYYNQYKIRRSTIKAFSNGSTSLGLTWYTNFAIGQDCIIYLENVKLQSAACFNNSYIHGTVNCNNGNFVIWQYATNVIYDVKVLNCSDVIRGNGSVELTGFGIVINCSPGYIDKPSFDIERVTFLTTEEIHDPKNAKILYAAGIPVNPNDER